MDTLHEEIRHIVEDKVMLIEDRDLRDKCIAYLNDLYNTLLSYEKSGEDPKTVIKAVAQVTHPKMQEMMHLINKKEGDGEIESGTQLSSTVIAAASAFKDLQETIIVQIRARRA